MDYGRACQAALDMEVARAVVSALSYDSPDSAREFHVNAFRALFADYAEASRYRSALSAMKLLGEIEYLSNGFWLAAPVRLVALGAYDLVVAPNCTKNLAIDFPSLRTAGLGRVIPCEASSPLPRQSLDSWLRSAISSPASVLRQAERQHFAKSRPTVLSETVEYFFVGRRVQSHGHGWSRNAAQGARFLSGMSLCRDRISPTQYRYFIVTLRHDKSHWESEVVGAPLQLQYAIAAHLSMPVTLTLRQVDQTHVAFGLSASLPLPEYRLIRALAYSARSDQGTREFVTTVDDLPPIEQRLLALGCQRTLINEN
jgi:hypothetical protein